MSKFFNFCMSDWQLGDALCRKAVIMSMKHQPISNKHYYDLIMAHRFPHECYYLWGKSNNTSKAPYHKKLWLI